jgi:protein ImuA
MTRIVAFPKTGRPDAPQAAGRVGLPAAASLTEVFAGAAGDAAAAGFVLAQLGRAGGPVLWIQDQLSRRETGQPYLPGLRAQGLGAGRLLLLTLTRPADVLVAAEEGLGCAALAGVVAEIWGDPSALCFTATKRLALRAEAQGVPCWLIRHGATADLSAARDRWRIRSLPAARHPDDPRAPGDPCWGLELFRSRDKVPGRWQARHDRAADRIDLAAAVPDGTLAADTGPAGQCHAG